ncbi:MAG: ABC transporter ATP-binding protein [Anaerolineae bacterium]|nr:ABC transporter ATP-binding protein [Anaerolineae bacterium]
MKNPHENFIDVQHVSTLFPSRRRGHPPVVAVDNVSFSLPANESTLLTIVGESGSGKTTLTRNLLGLTPPTEGQVLYQGKDIYSMSHEEWHHYRRDVQPVFQDPYATYNPFYRIDRVLQVPIHKFGLANSRKEARQLIDEALEAVDLRPSDVLGRYPHQLSGGERQRIMLARIYLIRPKLIIADEPVSMIDASLRTVFLNMLHDLRDNYGISCIHITHNLATAYYLGGDMMIMCRGQVIEQGDMDTIIDQPQHPYTQMLISSVPSPDPQDRWERGHTSESATEIAELKTEANACVFAGRCSHVMPTCQSHRPELIPINAEQETACFLYDQDVKPVDDAKEMVREKVNSAGYS